MKKYVMNPKKIKIYHDYDKKPSKKPKDIRRCKNGCGWCHLKGHRTTECMF